MSFRSVELVLLGAGAAVLGAVLILPRATRPSVWPMPSVNFAELRAWEKEERAVRQTLEFSRFARRVGEKLRRVGAASFAGAWPEGLEFGYSRPEAGSALQALREEVGLASDQQVQEVLDLSRYQSARFVEAVRAWERNKKVSLDLVELGGDFVSVATAAWLDRDGRVVLSDEELRLLFRVRFAYLTDSLERARLSPTKNQLLAYYGLLLEHPPVARELWPSSRRATVSAIAQLDPSYPADLAEALALLQTGQTDAAARILGGPGKSGPWSRLRQNLLLFAHERHAEF